MGRNKTPQEVQNEYVLAMGDELGFLFTELAEQVAWLHDKWNTFRALYSDDEGSIELLTATAPAFFDELARTLWADALLHLCRLTDAAEMNRGKFRNLSVEQLSAGNWFTDPLKSKVEQLISDARAATEFARHWRNRRYAHRELPLHCGGNNPSALPSADVTHIDKALKAIQAVLNAIEVHYCGCHVLYEETIGADGGVSDLTHLLHMGRALDGVRQAFARGEIKELPPFIRDIL